MTSEPKLKIEEFESNPYYREIAYLAKLEKKIFLLKRSGITNQDKNYRRKIHLANKILEHLKSRKRETYSEAIHYVNLMDDVNCGDEIQQEIFTLQTCRKHKMNLTHCPRCVKAKLQENG